METSGGQVMAIQEDILEAFFKKLQESNEFNDELVTKLRDLFKAGKTVKAPELVAVLSPPLPEPPA